MADTNRRRRPAPTEKPPTTRQAARQATVSTSVLAPDSPLWPGDTGEWDTLASLWGRCSGDATLATAPTLIPATVAVPVLDPVIKPAIQPSTKPVPKPASKPVPEPATTTAPVQDRFPDVRLEADSNETATPSEVRAPDTSSPVRAPVNSISPVRVPNATTTTALEPPMPTTDTPATAQSTSKRRKTRYLPLDLTNVQVTVPANTSLTVIYRPTNSAQNLSKSHQGLLFKELAAISEPSEVRDLRGGALAVDFPPETAPTALLAVTTLQGIPVKASLPAGQLSRTGVVRNLHPDVSQDEFLAEATSTVTITAFKRLAKPGATSWVAKLTFQGQELPDTVRYAGRTYRVSPYLHRPLQCRTCHKFNHVAASCKTGIRCPRCGDNHEIATCPVPEARCPNCGGPHLATDASCPARSFEVKVAEVRATSGLSLTAAKGAVRAAAKTYAAAARPTTSRPEPSRPAANRPEPSRNTIFSAAPSPTKAAVLTADVAAAVLVAAKTNSFAGLLEILEAILTAFTGVPLPAGALKGLIAQRTPAPTTV